MRSGGGGLTGGHRPPMSAQVARVEEQLHGAQLVGERARRAGLDGPTRSGAVVPGGVRPGRVEGAVRATQRARSVVIATWSVRSPTTSEHGSPRARGRFAFGSVVMGRAASGRSVRTIRVHPAVRPEVDAHAAPGTRHAVHVAGTRSASSRCRPARLDVGVPAAIEAQVGRQAASPGARSGGRSAGCGPARRLPPERDAAGRGAPARRNRCSPTPGPVGRSRHLVVGLHRPGRRPVRRGMLPDSARPQARADVRRTSKGNGGPVAGGPAVRS